MTAPLVPTSPVILNTRPLPMGETLALELAEHGVEAISFPTIVNLALCNEDIAAHSNQSFAQLLQILIEQLSNENAYWLFISKSSAQFFRQFLQSFSTNAQAFEFSPAGHVIAVGTTTKSEIETINSTLNVLTPFEANSEALLAMPEFEFCQQLVLVKGLGGRGLITEHFTQQHKQVVELNLYKRSAQLYEKQAIESWLTADIILATSVDIASATLDNINLLTEAQRQQFLQSKHWIVLSDRIKQFLISKSVKKQNIFVCEQSDNSSIIKMIKQIGKASS